MSIFYYDYTELKKDLHKYGGMYEDGEAEVTLRAIVDCHKHGPDDFKESPNAMARMLSTGNPKRFHKMIDTIPDNPATPLLKGMVKHTITCVSVFTLAFVIALGFTCGISLGK